MALYRYFASVDSLPSPRGLLLRTLSPATMSGVNKGVMDASKTQRSNSTPNITVYIIASDHCFHNDFNGHTSSRELDLSCSLRCDGVHACNLGVVIALARTWSCACVVGAGVWTWMSLSRK